ncbi:hypothetical protein OIDMADRAFT_17122 [Oidiodendron maius Zn]|uniref:Uncharacterized protein n=1 Tax=Oidiodendron maius (strain Zn) TaxID=913774 RepID=A0A0C3DV84_OIDMZ|nr:hypothetical protein OIDMADRAFT_17122 [Oidiodendron maius Zn]
MSRSSRFFSIFMSPVQLTAVFRALSRLTRDPNSYWLKVGANIIVSTTKWIARQ